MGILDEGLIDKALEFTEKLKTEKSWKKIYEVVDNEYFKQSNVGFQNILY